MWGSADADVMAAAEVAQGDSAALVDAVMAGPEVGLWEGGCRPCLEPPGEDEEWCGAAQGRGGGRWRWWLL